MLNLKGIKPYHPNKRTSVLWFKRINDSIFRGKLPEPENFVIRKNLIFSGHPSWAYYYKSNEYESEPDNPYTRSKFIPGATFVLTNVFPNKKFFIEILAHEMIHHYQYINGKPLGHGENFFRWTKRFNKQGLNLSVTYEDISVK